MPPKSLIWLDANISPAIALWLNNNFEVECKSCFVLNMQKESDIVIYAKAKEANAIFITKDKDFAELQSVHKSPPKLILLNSGNVSNTALKEILNKTFQRSLELLLNSGYETVHIS